MASIFIKDWTTINIREIIDHITTLENEITTITRKLYNQPNGILTTIIVIYLLITLIVVVKITDVSRGPLRQTR
jgi:hypothetical protein